MVFLVVLTFDRKLKQKQLSTTDTFLEQKTQISQNCSPEMEQSMSPPSEATAGGRKLYISYKMYFCVINVWLYVVIYSTLKSWRSLFEVGLNHCFAVKLLLLSTLYGWSQGALHIITFNRRGVITTVSRIDQDKMPGLEKNNIAINFIDT